MKHVQKKIWLPWTCANVWDALIDLRAIVFWAPLHVYGDRRDRSLVPGAVLLWKPAQQICFFRPSLTLTVEQMLPCQAIHCSFSTRAFQGKLDISLSPEEGDEATTIAIGVTVEYVASHRSLWGGAPLVRGVIQRQVARAFLKLDTLLEYRQEQAEQGFNVAYRSWQRLQAEREHFRRQFILQSMQDRSR